VKNWFQNLPFKCDVHRYSAVIAGTTYSISPKYVRIDHVEVGLCTLNQVDPQLKGAWFQNP
jgi:hypothetical protein